MTYQEDRRKQQDAAAARVRAMDDEREQIIEVLNLPGGIALADSPERIATRIDRLSRYRADVRPVTPQEVEAGLAAALDVSAERPVAVDPATAVLERVIGTADFLGVAYLEVGAGGTVGGAGEHPRRSGSPRRIRHGLPGVPPSVADQPPRAVGSMWQHKHSSGSPKGGHARRRLCPPRRPPER